MCGQRFSFLRRPFATRSHERVIIAQSGFEKKIVWKTALPESSKVALVKWHVNDELAQVLANELTQLGYRPQFFQHDAEIPPDAAIVLTFAPYGELLPILRRAASRLSPPLVAHWNFEGSPDLGLPWQAVYTLSALRSRLDGIPLLNRKWKRYRYLGDYFYAYRRGWLDVLAVISQQHETIYQAHGLPAQYVPWGTSPQFYRTLNLERDIDVLWFGKRRDSHRSTLIEQVRAEMQARGFNMLLADGVEHPFIYGNKRTEILNRSKIVLNVKTLAQNSGFTFRFHMVAGNRALIVAEDFLSHVPNYQAGVHYASAPSERLAQTIVYYLEHESERAALAENAFQLATTEMTLYNSVRKLMQCVEASRAA